MERKLQPSHSYYTVEFNNKGDLHKSSMEFSTLDLAEEYYEDVKDRWDNSELVAWEVNYRVMDKKGEFKC